MNFRAYQFAKSGDRVEVKDTVAGFGGMQGTILPVGPRKAHVLDPPIYVWPAVFGILNGNVLYTIVKLDYNTELGERVIFIEPHLLKRLARRE